MGRKMCEMRFGERGKEGREVRLLLMGFNIKMHRVSQCTPARERECQERKIKSWQSGWDELGTRKHVSYF